jgi:hypothetical protein
VSPPTAFINMTSPSQATYAAGSVVDLTFQLTANQ